MLDGVQERERGAAGRVSHLGEVHRGRDVPRREAALSGHSLQPLREPAVRAHLPHRRHVPARRRHRRVRQGRLHRLQGVHAGVPLRRDPHRPGDQHGGKCHYCSHRIEVGLEPSCAVVCPTHAIIAGDLDDPESEISRRCVAKNKVTVRKPEQGTAPKVFYIEGHEVSLTPTAAGAPDTFMWADMVTAQGVGKMRRLRRAQFGKWRGESSRATAAGRSSRRAVHGRRAPGRPHGAGRLQRAARDPLALAGAGVPGDQGDRCGALSVSHAGVRARARSGAGRRRCVGRRDQRGVHGSDHGLARLRPREAHALSLHPAATAVALVAGARCDLR